MKKCSVFCASSIDKDKKYLPDIIKLMERLVKQFEIVYGGANTGYMREVALLTKKFGGQLMGIMPKFLESKELRFLDCDSWLETDTMNQRKELLFQVSDCFVALPGGVGTYEEVIDLLSWLHIGLINKPVVICNFKGFFNGLKAQLEQGIADEFIHSSLMDLICISDNIDEIMDYLNQSKSEMFDIYTKDHKALAKTIRSDSLNTLTQDQYVLSVKAIVKSTDEKILVVNDQLPIKNVLAYQSSQQAIELLLESLVIKGNPVLKHQLVNSNTHQLIDYYEVIVDNEDNRFISKDEFILKQNGNLESNLVFPQQSIV